MKYTAETIQTIFAMKQQGMSSRKIANAFGISKSGVNDMLNRYATQIKPKGMRLLFLDLETSADIAVSFKRFKTSYGQDSVLQDGGTILSISWQYNDEQEPSGLALSPYEAVNNDDSRLVATLIELIEDSDAICGHNIVQFDDAVIQARSAINGFAPHKLVKKIDTLRIARQMKFPSNKLDSLGHMLGVGRKMEHQGIKLWIDCMFGHQQALDTMLEYNKQDVTLLIDVYNKLKAFDSKAPNAGLYTDELVPVCRVCGSTHVEPTGNVVSTAVSKFIEVQCGECGARSRTRQSLNTSKERKLLLA